MESASSPRAWQPLTFGGVASFAGATLTRLWIVQLIASLFVAASVVWLLATDWVPVIERAISRLPDQAAIRRRQLSWTGNAPPAPLAENQFLSIRVELEESFPVDQSADVQMILRRGGLNVQSLLGFIAIPYPEGWTMSLNRADVRAWWDAWRSFLLIGAGIAVVLLLFASWFALGCLYAFPVRLIAFYLDRNVTWWSGWRLAGAAVLPGAIVMACAILLYSSHRLDLVGLLFAWLLHILVGWVYVAYSPTRLSRLGGPPTLRGNPFGTRKG